MRLFQIPKSRACALISFLLLAASIAHAQRFPVYKDLHDFGGTTTNANGKTGPDGSNPFAGVAFDSAGNVYGTAPSGGANGGSAGMLFEVTKAGTYIDLHDFGGTVVNADGQSGLDGSDPVSGVVFDGNGNMFGATVNGGANGMGMVWEITQAGVYKDIHDFGGSITDAQGQTSTDGINPHAGLTTDASGNIYGATIGGGPFGSGVVWEITAAGTYRDLHDFGNKYVDGSELLGSVTVDKIGDIVGTTVYGGANNVGIVWEVTNTGTFEHLHDFGGSITNANGKTGPDGTTPATGVTIDSSGDIFGTTPTGGANNNGMMWEITSSGDYLDLHDFGGTVVNANGQSGPDGAHPLCVITLGSDGNLYGSTSIGGPNDQGDGNNGAGMVWEMTKSGTYTDLFDVGGSVTHPGFGIEGNVVFDADGNLYATSVFGGANYSGTLWELGALSPSALTISPSSVLGGQSATGTITLDGIAQTGGSIVFLTSNSASATVPPSVTVAAGASSATFSIGSLAVGSSTAATITATLAGIPQTAVLTVTPAVLSSFTASPATVVGGLSSVGAVSLNGPAPTGGTVINLASNSASATPPATVTVSAGMASATFGVETIQVTAATTASLTASLAGTTLKASLTLNPLALTSLKLSPSSVAGGNSSVGTVTLNGPAGSSGAVVTLSSSATSAATVPASITISSGQTSGMFSVATSVVTAQKSATIVATFASATQSAMLTVVPASLASVTLNPGTVTGGSSTSGTVMLTGPAPKAGIVVKLKSTSSAASMPASVTVPAAKISAAFNVKTQVVRVATDATITGTYGSAAQTATLTVNPPTLKSIALSPTAVVGLTPSKGTVTLSGVAPSGGIAVQLSSGNAAATVPALVTVPAGQASATFTMKTVAVAVQTSGAITGTLGSAKAAATLTVNPPVLKSVTLNPSSVVGGKSSTGTVTLTSAAPAGGIAVLLASGDKAASVPKNVTVAAGATTAKFTITTSAVTAATKVSISATLGTTVSASLTVNK